MDEGWVRYDPVSGETLVVSPLARFLIDFFDAVPTASADDAIDELERVKPGLARESYTLAIKESLPILAAAKLIGARP